MKPQDHSDTTLLVWSDWLEENGEEQKAHELREEIAHPPVDRWDWEYLIGGGSRVGGIVSGFVGGAAVGEDVGGVGSGTAGSMVGGIFNRTGSLGEFGSSVGGGIDDTAGADWEFS